MPPSPSLPAAPSDLTEAAVSAALGVSRRTLQRWRKTGRGPAFVRVGPRMVRYARADLSAWRRRNRVATA